MPESPALLTAEEVALIFRVNRSTVQRWRTSGVLKGVKVGGLLRFKRSDVEALLDPERAA